MRARRKVQIAVAVVALVVAAYLVFCGVVAAYVRFSGNQRNGNDVSLIFQRYSDDADSYVSDVAFLLLTNASSESYIVSMTGGSNTLVLDLLWGRNKQSIMINCEFTDETPSGWTNWT